MKLFKKNLIEKCRNIVKERQYEVINDITVDMQTANCIITIYDAVNSKNKKKLKKLNIHVLANVCWVMYGKCKI